MKIIEESEPYSLPSRNKEYIFRSVRGTVQVDGSSSEHKICLLSMPHLSRFKIDARGDETNSAYDARTAIDWMNEEKNRYLSWQYSKYRDNIIYYCKTLENYKMELYWDKYKKTLKFHE